MPHPPLPKSTLGTPDNANDTEGVHSVAHSIRLHGALLRTVDYAGHMAHPKAGTAVARLSSIRRPCSRRY